MPRGPLIATTSVCHWPGATPANRRVWDNRQPFRETAKVSGRFFFLIPATLAPLLQTAIRKSLLKHRQLHAAQNLSWFPMANKGNSKLLNMAFYAFHSLALVRCFSHLQWLLPTPNHLWPSHLNQTVLHQAMNFFPSMPLHIVTIPHVVYLPNKLYSPF